MNGSIITQFETDICFRMPACMNQGKEALGRYPNLNLQISH